MGSPSSVKQRKYSPRVQPYRTLSCKTLDPRMYIHTYVVAEQETRWRFAQFRRSMWPLSSAYPCREQEWTRGKRWRGCRLWNRGDPPRVEGRGGAPCSLRQGWLRHVSPGHWFAVETSALPLRKGRRNVFRYLRVDGDTRGKWEAFLESRSPVWIRTKRRPDDLGADRTT